MKLPIEEYQNGINLAREIVFEVDEKIKRIFWTNEQIDEFFAKRSATEIIYSGTTGFMNPCLDLTLVSSSIMSSKVIPHFFVIEEHLPTLEFPFNRLHFALDFQHKDIKYFLNYKKANEVHIGKGEYGGRQDIPLSQIIRIPGEIINPYRSLCKSLGYDTLNDLIQDKFNDYSLQSNIDRLKQDNYKENFISHKKECGEKFKIIIKP
jgi:hypothetical protein